MIDFSKEDPVEIIQGLTGGIGADRVIDAVGVDAERPTSGPAAQKIKQMEEEFQRELKKVAPETHLQGTLWKPGDAPSLVINWAIESLAKAGTFSIIGVYPQTARFFPIGMAMNRNLTINMGNCNHRKYIPRLLDLIESRVIDPAKILTRVEPIAAVLDAYKAFDQRQPGWIKVEIVPEMAGRKIFKPEAERRTDLH